MELLPALKRQSTTFTPLDFTNSPTKSSPSVTKEIDPTLSASSSKNERCLEYELWLWNAHVRAVAFVTSRDPKTKLRGEILSKDLSDAISKPDGLERCDWESVTPPLKPVRFSHCASSRKSNSCTSSAHLRLHICQRPPDPRSLGPPYFRAGSGTPHTLRSIHNAI
jgi:hypothetical protein